MCLWKSLFFNKEAIVFHNVPIVLRVLQDISIKELKEIAELMAKVSKREAGSVTPETLVYDGINSYEHREFLLNSKTVTVEDYFDDPVMTKTDDNGIKVESALEYVAYTTDGGVSELSANPGANTTVITNAKGFVTSYVETFNDAVNYVLEKNNDINVALQIKGYESFVLSVEGSQYENCFSNKMKDLVKEMGYSSLHELIRSIEVK